MDHSFKQGVRSHIFGQFSYLLSFTMKAVHRLYLILSYVLDIKCIIASSKVFVHTFFDGFHVFLVLRWKLSTTLYEGFLVSLIIDLCPYVSWYGVPVCPDVTLRGWRGVQIQETSLTCLHLFLSDFCDESCQLASYERFLVGCVLARANKLIARTLFLFHFINFPCGASRKLRSESV